MSSSGRYQSKLFNFLFARSRQLSKQWDKAGQQLRELAQSGAHLLLVPVYAVYQATRFVTKQLTGGAQKSPGSDRTIGSSTPSATDASHPSNTACETLAADTAIQQVLNAVEIVTCDRQDTDSGVQVSIKDIPSPQLPTRNIQEPPSWIHEIESWKNWITVKTVSLLRWKGFPGNGSLVKPSETAKTLSVKGAIDLSANPNNLANLVIRGIATVLEGRNLVLVSDRNQILDILTPAQQQQLQARIHWALDHYWGTQQSLEPGKPALQGSEQPILQQSTEEKRPGLPSGRGFRGLIAPGEQTHPIFNLLQRSLAKAANLFQPSSLVLHPSALSDASGMAGSHLTPDRPNPQTPTPRLQEAFLVLDRAVARAEAVRLPQTGELATIAVQGTGSLMQAIEKLGVALVSDREAPFSPVTPADSASPLQRIDLLIRSAIDYFFGSAGGSLPGENTDNPQTWSVVDEPQNIKNVKLELNPSPEAISQLTDNPKPKLTLSSLFGVRGVSQFLNADLPVAPSPNTASAIPDPTPQSSLAESVRQFQTVALPKNERGIALPKPATQPVTGDGVRGSAASAVTQTAAIHPGKSKSETLPPHKENASEMDWIDAKVTQVEYVKHPLEQVLDWLDRIMVSIEAIAVRLWEWTRQHLFS